MKNIVHRAQSKIQHDTQFAQRHNIRIQYSISHECVTRNNNQYWEIDGIRIPLVDSIRIMIFFDAVCFCFSSDIFVFDSLSSFLSVCGSLCSVFFLIFYFTVILHPSLSLPTLFECRYDKHLRVEHTEFHSLCNIFSFGNAIQLFVLAFFLFLLVIISQSRKIVDHYLVFKSFITSCYQF